ncbi:ABC-type Zn2+ transport system substrate-binding protein/surface adhesin [Oxalobacteraceae bacterium GrIS 2.11]
MNQSRLVKLAVFCVAAVLLSGCVLEGRGGYRDDDRHDHDRGDQHEHHHDDRGDHDH